MSYGFNGYMGLGKEVAWGSGVAVTDYFMGLNEDLKVDIDRYDIRNIVGTVAEPDDDSGIVRVAGSITFGAHPVTIGHFLKGTMQTMSGSVITSGYLWKNDFTTSTADFNAATTPVQPYTFEIFRDTSSGSVQYAGCVVDQLELSWAPNQNVRAKASIIGRGQTVIAKSTSTPTYPGSPIADFNFDTTSISIGGSATARIEALTMQINNNLEGIPTLNNSTAVAKIRRRGPQTIMLNGTIDFVDFAEYTDFINQTEQRWVWHTTAPASCYLTVDLPRVIYTAYPLSTPGRERLTVSFNAKAFYSTGSATAAKISLSCVKSNY